MSGALLSAAAAAYAAGLLASWLHLFSRRRGLATAGLALAAAGFVMHTASYGLDCAPSHAMVIMTRRGSFSLLALLTVAVMLAVAMRHGMSILGAFVLPLAVAGAAAAAAAPDVPPPAAHLHGALFAVHVLTSYLGFAGFATATGVAAAWLVQARELKSRRPQAVAYALPPLAELDALAAGLAALSLACLAAGIGTGLLYSKSESGQWWTNEPKAVATVISAAIYAAGLGLRQAAGWRGRKTAWLLLAGFALVCFTFAGLGHDAATAPIR